MTHEESQAVTEAEAPPVPSSAQPEPPAPPPDSENPAIIDARKTFVITLISAVLFIGAILLFIL